MAGSRVFPKASQITAVLKAARDLGVTKLKIGDFEAEWAGPPIPEALPDGAALVAAINRAAPLPRDPLEIIREENGREARKLNGRDALEVLASGGRLTINDSGDPTEPVAHAV